MKTIKKKTGKNIQMADVIAGGGKTHSAMDDNHSLINNYGRVLMVQPTKALIDETHIGHLLRCQQAGGKISDELLANPPSTIDIGRIRYSKVHGDIETLEEGAPVLPELIKEIKRTNGEWGGEDEDDYLLGAIILTTHLSFLSLAMRGDSVWDTFDLFSEYGDLAGMTTEHKALWSVVVDEEMDVFEALCLKTMRRGEVITCFDVSDFGNDDFLRLVLSGTGIDLRPLKAWSKLNLQYNKDLKAEIKLSRQVLSDVHDLYIKRDDWDQLQADTYNGDINIFSILTSKIADGYKSFSVMSACLKESLQYRIWSSEGAVFTDNERIIEGLQYKEHKNGELLTIKYCTEANWSKYFMEKSYDGGTNLDEVIRCVKEEFSGQDFVWNANVEGKLGVNNGKLPTMLFDHVGGINIGGNPHGLNKYKHITRGAFITAANLPDTNRLFLDKVFGISRDEQRAMIAYQGIYQSAMRTALRDPNNTKSVEIIVCSKGCAESLQAMFPGSSIERIGNLPITEQKSVGRPKMPDKMSKGEIEKRSKAKNARLEALVAMADKPFCVTAAKDLRTKPTGKPQGADGWGKMVGGLRGQAGRVVENQDDLKVLCPAKFKDGAEDMRRESVEYASFVVLDIDDNDMPPDALYALFPDLAMVAINTHTGNGRYRVFIPSTQAIPMDVYHNIQDQLRGVIEAAGFIDSKNPVEDKNRHGIDGSKRGIESRFRLPCLASTGKPEDSFFIEFDGEPLDPVDWIGNERFNTREFYAEDRKVTGATKLKKVDVEALISTYRDVTKGRGMRRHAFFTIAQIMYSAGIKIYDMRNHLYRADYDGSRNERNEIEGVIKSLLTDRYGQPND